MANRIKSPKKPKPNPEQLKPEKDVQVSVKELVKDERTHKIAGTLSLLVCLFLFIAFTSYLFTWRQDQDKVFGGAGILMPSSDIRTENLLGNLGAYISHQFFFNGFGIGSFLFCTIFFVIGINAIAGKKVFSIWRNVRYLITGLLFFSVAASFLFSSTMFPWGGAVGNLVSNWLVHFLGSLGTAVLLIVTGLTYFIWRFNPVFHIPERKAKTILPIDSAETGIDTEIEIPDQPVEPTRAT
ncbi:MAG TPA: DNA translocase FtsK 4TM domain-containing protein, partial [Flavitalea sp.]|nr:DNA translocase FtsK 4TM domain-containing protein [Flavitalea sp.]